MVNLTGELNRAGCVLRYADSGGADNAIVLTHGAGADHHMFDAQFNDLAASGRRAVVWDMRAHGQSTPNSEPFSADLALQDLSALVDHLDLSHPVLAGHSLGGNLSQALVRRQPQRFAGLVVMDSTWNTGPLTKTERFLMKVAAPSLRIIPARSLPGLMSRASAVTPEARSDATRAFSQMTKRQFVEVWKATVLLVEPDPIYRTPIPLCLIRGSHDKTGNIARAMPRWADTEGVTEHVVPGAGHLVTQDAPDAVTVIMQSFLATIPTTA
jgi:3-oxoadipate enol-lactonase